MLLSVLAILGGFILLLWSADRFVEGASVTARHAGMPPLLIGMVVVGFGTSAPEMVVSAMAALDDNPGLALGNALGSNIVNIGLILGLTAVLAPIAVHSAIVRRELPLLMAIGAALGAFLWNGSLTRTEALMLVAGFFALIGWSVFNALRARDDHLEKDVNQELTERIMPLGRALFWLLVGLALLIASSRILVWGAVNIAQQLGVSDLVIGLTIVAIGTSLPELAASIIAVRKGEHDIAVGNVVGSNMFNILAVVGIAGVISPMTSLAPEVLARDWGVMMGLTFLLWAAAVKRRGIMSVSRLEGSILLSAYIAYNAWLISSVWA